MSIGINFDLMLIESGTSAPLELTHATYKYLRSERIDHRRAEEDAIEQSFCLFHLSLDKEDLRHYVPVLIYRFRG